MRRTFDIIFYDRIGLQVDNILVEHVVVDLPDCVEIYTGFPADLCFEDEAQDSAWRQRKQWYTSAGIQVNSVTNQDIVIREIVPAALGKSAVAAAR